MRTTVTLDSSMVEELLKATKARSKAKAVSMAIEGYLKKRKIEKVKSMKGKLDFDISAEEIRHRER